MISIKLTHYAYCHNYLIYTTYCIIVILVLCSFDIIAYKNELDLTFVIISVEIYYIN